ncbi:MAG: hypothetical protein KC616_07835 [Myxococcales bacterium]|nr:hypothetical protein [Myxococcales bacterium]
MVYVVAAYSITVVVLGLYGVLLAHRSRLLRLEEDAVPGAARSGRAADPRRGFDLGAALLAPFWLLAHGMPGMGLLLLVPCLALAPLVARGLWLPALFVALVPIAAGAALGFAGHRIAAERTGLTDPRALARRQLPWALAGMALWTFVLPWALYLVGAD